MAFHCTEHSETGSFSRNLKFRRTSIPGLSQRRMARNLGVSRDAYARYENGTRLPPAWFVVKAANYFGITVEELYKEKEV